MADEPKSPPQDKQAAGAEEQPGPVRKGGAEPGTPPTAAAAGERPESTTEAGREAATTAVEAPKVPLTPPKAAEESAGPEISSAKPPAPSPKPAAPGAKPAGPATPAAKPAAPPAKPAAPAAKPAPKPVIKPEPWSSPQVDAIKERFGGAVIEALTFRNQNWITLALDQLLAVCQFLLSPEGGGFDYLADETAVDYPKREKRFEIVYILYSFTRNERLRLKVAAGENDEVPSVVGLWPVANWLEREIYDMFGIRFSGHPDLKRILLPDGWTGHPLRKDYDILRQDTAWVKENLKIESGQ